MNEPTQLIPPHWRRVPWKMLAIAAAVGIWLGLGLGTMEPAHTPAAAQPTPLHTAADFASIPPGQIPTFGGRLPCGESADEEEVNGAHRVLRCADGHTWDATTGAYLGRKESPIWKKPPPPGAGFEVYRCPTCHGLGAQEADGGWIKCGACGGSGYITARYGIVIPPTR